MFIRNLPPPKKMGLKIHFPKRFGPDQSPERRESAIDKSSALVAGSVIAK